MKEILPRAETAWKSYVETFHVDEEHPTSAMSRHAYGRAYEDAMHQAFRVLHAANNANDLNLMVDWMGSQGSWARSFSNKASIELSSPEKMREAQREFLKHLQKNG